jgi:hypothetical protein
MSARGAILDPADAEGGGAEINLIPAKVAQFRRSKLSHSAKGARAPKLV